MVSLEKCLRLTVSGQQVSWAFVLRCAQLSPYHCQHQNSCWRSLLT